MTTETLRSIVSTLDVLAKIAIAAIAGWWGLHTYPESREKEFRKSYWDKQMSLLFEASGTAAQIAILPPGDSRRADAVEAFWKLYWGSMTVVESKCERCDPVDQAMIAFGLCLTDPADSKPKQACDAKELEQRSIALGKAARDSIGTSWDRKLESLTRGCRPDKTCPATTTE